MACGLALDGNSSSATTRENESKGERDVSNMVTQKSTHSDEAASRRPGGKVLATAQVEHKVFASNNSKDKAASSGSSTEAKERMVPHAEIPPKLAAAKPRVTFDTRLTTAVWPALSDYDRTSIVVDLSKTPFALFRKDAVLMAKSAAAATAPAEHCVPSSPAPLASRIPTKDISVSTAGGANDDGIESSPQPDAVGSRLLSVSLDYESDSSSAVTDTETMSETDSIPCLDWEGGGMEEEGPAFYGVWKRTSSVGYEALLLSSGVPKRAIAMALRKHPVHIIDHDGSYFRLIVKNGLSKADNTFFIGDEPRTVSFVFCVRFEVFASESTIVRVRIYFATDILGSYSWSSVCVPSAPSRESFQFPYVVRALFYRPVLKEEAPGLQAPVRQTISQPTLHTFIRRLVKARCEHLT